MFNYWQKYFLVFLFIYTQSLVAMENDKTIIPTKSTFTPTANTPQANAELLEILNKSKNLQENWENIKKCLQNGADPNLKYGFFQNPLICLAVEYNRKDLFDYLLQLGADINAHEKYGWTPLHVFILHRPTDFCINDLLENRANTNAMTIFCGNLPMSTQSTPLSLAIKQGHFDFIKPLIQFKANVNYKKSDSKYPLRLAIKSENNDAIGQLCAAGASIINLDNYNHPHTVFHIVANEICNPKKIIKTLMTHINFKNNDNNLTNIIKTFLLVFHRFNNDPKSNSFNIPHIPQEIQILILSKLLSSDCFHQGLYKQCKGKHYFHLPLKLVNDHILHLKQILQRKDCYYRTALEILPKKDPYAFAYGYRTDDEKLLEGTTLQNDLDILNSVFWITPNGKYPNLSSIPKDNLALQILENHYNIQG